MLDQFGHYLVQVADFICGYPLFFLLIGGGLYLFLSSGAISVRRLPDSIRVLREKTDHKDGQISSVQALLSAVAGTVGLGNIAGVAIALVMGGPGAIFWMWVSALVGMATKYHEGALAVMYKGSDKQGNPRGGMMYIIQHGLGPKWTPLAKFFAIAGMFGTLCIMNANQLTEGVMAVFTTPDAVNSSTLLSGVGAVTGLSNANSFKLLFGLAVAITVALVVLRGVTRIARVASVLVPFMVGVYFLMVLYIILTHLGDVPGVFVKIFSEAFSLRAGWGALAGIAIIGARRAALVNDAGIGTASIMHGASRNSSAPREGLIAMLGPSIDSGFVCTLTAVALLLVVDFNHVEGVKGLEVAMHAFNTALPFGSYLLMFVVFCFALSSMFSYSYYGTSCATYLFGEKKARWYTYAYIASLVLFSIVPLEAAIGMCDLFYAFMAFPTMFTLIMLSSRVRKVTKAYFAEKKEISSAASK
jgi:AGCS family alanine or glycine:cation symporter